MKFINSLLKIINENEILLYYFEYGFMVIIIS